MLKQKRDQLAVRGLIILIKLSLIMASSILRLCEAYKFILYKDLKDYSILKIIFGKLNSLNNCLDKSQNEARNKTCFEFRKYPILL